MNWFLAVGISINQATGERPVVWIVFKLLALIDTGKYVVIRQLVIFGFILSVVGDMYSTMTFRTDNILNVHAADYKEPGMSYLPTGYFRYPYTIVLWPARSPVAHPMLALRMGDIRLFLNCKSLHKRKFSKCV